MKIKAFNSIIAIAFIFSLASCAQGTKDVKASATQAAQKGQISELISPSDLNTKLGDIQLIDVRTPNEYASGHIKGSKNINFYDGNFIEEMSKLNKDREVYIYCRSGGRSGKAASKLKAVGFTKIYDLQGGMKNWNSNKLETIK